MKIRYYALVFWLFLVSFSLGDESGILGKYEYEEAEYILTLTVVRTTSREHIERIRSGEFMELAVNERLEYFQSEGNAQVVSKTLRMIYGKSQFDNLHALQYAVQDENGQYKLIPSSCKQGVRVALEYKLSNSMLGFLELKGECGLWQACKREVFLPFPELDAGKPSGHYTGGMRAINSAFPIRIGETSIASQYSRANAKKEYFEAVIATMLIEKASEWKGELSDIINHSNVWIVHDPNPPKGGGIRPELLIKRAK